MSEGSSPPPMVRGETRHPVAWKATIRCADWKAAEHVAATNVSKGGMFVRSDRPPAVGTPVEIVLLLPDGRQEQLSGTVRHQVSHGPSTTVTGVGVELDPFCRPLMCALAEIARIEQGLAGASPPSRPRPPPPPPRPPVTPARPTSDAVGIDFGVSFCRISVSGGAGSAMIVDEQGRALMPSLIAFPEGGGPEIGWRAHGLQVAMPHRTLSSLKRLLGRRHEDPKVAGALQALPLPHQAGPDGGILIEVGGGWMAVPQVCALLLGALKSMAEKRTGRPLERATFSHPVVFGDEYRGALQRTAQLAGLEVAGFVEEPLAGALGYGVGLDGAKNEVVAVYDFGGGTFDFSLVDLSYQSHRVLASGGDDWLGGDDFDLAIAEAAANAYWRTHRIELRDRVVEWSRLLRAAEAAKRELGARPSARLSLPDLRPALELTLDRNALQRLCRPLLERSLQICKETLERAGLEPAQVTQLVLSGGTSQIPFIQEALSQLFDRPVQNTSGLDPQEAVALGASVFGATRASR